MRRRFRLLSKGVLLAVALLVAVSEVDLNASSAVVQLRARVHGGKALVMARSISFPAASSLGK
jgi:hypothetical protein